MKYIIVAILALAGCAESKHGPNLEWSENKSSNTEAIKSYIPIGAKAYEALNLMKEAGFKCKIHRDKTKDQYKGTTYLGEVGPPDHIACQKPKLGSSNENWVVILIIDQTDKISRFSVTIEPNEH